MVASIDSGYGRESAINRNFRFFLAIYRKQIRFLLIFGAIFLLINFFYLLSSHTPVRTFILTVITAKPSATIINLISPENGVVLRGHTLVSNHSAFAIVTGCEGAQAIFLLVAALCAFPMSRRLRVTGVVFGILFLYVLNLARIVGLHYVAGYYGKQFEFAHWFVGQTFIVIASLMFFLFWITKNAAGNE